MAKPKKINIFENDFEEFNLCILFYLIVFMHFLTLDNYQDTINMESFQSHNYRDREDHLQVFLHHLHPILQRQQLDYRIFIVEQSREERFNRGTLLNVGFVEALKTSDDFRCFVFHDVDLLPEDDR